MSEHFVPGLLTYLSEVPKWFEGPTPPIEMFVTPRSSQLGARGKRRGFSPGAAARHSQSARAYTDRFGNPNFQPISSWAGSTRDGSKRWASADWTPIFFKNLSSAGWTHIFLKSGFSRLKSSFFRRHFFAPESDSVIFLGHFWVQPAELIFDFWI